MNLSKPMNGWGSRWQDIRSSWGGDEADWVALEQPIKDLHIPPDPSSPPPEQLDTWFPHSLDTLRATIRLHTPVSRPSPKSKPWWTLSLTTLRREYARARRTAKKHRTEASIGAARLSRQEYFRAIKKAKNSHWAKFLDKTTPYNIWTAKRFVAPCKTQHFPELPGADSSVKINKALLNHFSSINLIFGPGCASGATPQQPRSPRKKLLVFSPNPLPCPHRALTGPILTLEKCEHHNP